MTIALGCSDRTFGQQHFGDVDLGHRARNACLVKLADRLSRHPGGTLPQKLASPKHYKALMRLVNRDEVTHPRVLQPHSQRTRRLMQETPGVVLLVHDTTELDFSGLKSIPDLGQIGNGHGRGYLCHNTLAVVPGQRQVLGLAHQILHNRPEVLKGEGVKAKRERQSRESRLWTRAVQALGPAPAGRLWVDVADRGADIFEFLAYEVQHGRACVVRAAYNRAIQVGHDAGAGAKAYLFGYARSLPEWGRKSILVAGRDGAKDRTASVAVAAAPVLLLPPHVRRGEYLKAPLAVWVVRVWEPNPPKGVKGLEWVLVTNVPVPAVEQAWERVSWYECRWVVEEYHKAQKTGCSIEEMQFTTAAALQPAIAVLSVVALLLLNLREASRQADAAERQATEVVAPEYVEVLSGWRYGELRSDLTIQEFFMALARLGGHQNRKRDRRPGWLVLWRGWMKLQHMLDGAEAVGYKSSRREATKTTSGQSDRENRGQT
jgi:hypothetical protein